MPWAGTEWMDDEAEYDNAVDCPHCGAAQDELCRLASLERGCVWTAPVLAPYQA